MTSAKSPIKPTQMLAQKDGVCVQCGLELRKANSARMACWCGSEVELNQGPVSFRATHRHTIPARRPLLAA